MRRHFETLAVILAAATHGGRVSARWFADVEPRRRRPRLARSTYVPVRRDRAVAMRFAH